MTRVGGLSSFVDPHTPIDLTNCDREPIHIPGAIQPHGLLLAWNEAQDSIVVASANAATALDANGADVIGRSLRDVLGAAVSDAIRASLSRHELRRETTAILPGGNGWLAGQRADICIYRSGGLVVLEFERADPSSELTPAMFRDVVRDTLGHIEHANTLIELAAQMAEQMRRITAFDRVWVYRFHEDWHGEIIGESKREGIEPWLGLHYPASDIPAQARALFLRNWVRSIPDISFTPVPLRPDKNPLTGEPLDLSLSVLRSVSPIHVQYLKNMGVTASLVVSLIHRGELWGLISGHHYSGPKPVPYATRTLCEFLAQALSLQVGLAEEVEDRDRMLAIRSVETNLAERLGRTTDYREALTSGSPNLLDLTRATGAAVCEVDSIRTVGATPSHDQLSALTAWLIARRTDVFHTTSLSAHFAPASAYEDIASGLLAVTLSSARPNYILWFRPESRQKISWGGDPRKSVEIDRDGVSRLSPRGSFALWEAERRGRSTPWDAAEIEAAVDLRRSALDVLLRRAEELGKLNVELEAQADELLQQRSDREELLERERDARAEAERANRAKAEFLAMMSHELRTPLNAIGGYAQIIAMGARGPITEQQGVDLERIQTSQRHLLGIVNSILNFAKVEAGEIQLDFRRVDVRQIVEDIGALTMPQITKKNITFERRPGDEPLLALIDTERANQIVLNMLSNAIKFTPEGGSITVSAERRGDDVVIEVRDTGRGIPTDKLASIFDPFVQIDRHTAPRGEEGVGLGLAISRDLARKMKGDLTAVSQVGHGSTFTLRLPHADHESNEPAKERS